MAKSLFQKGADFTTAMIFMFASTNLVLELGIVLLVLMGWQFAAAEFIGGPIMIVLLALVGGIVFTPKFVKAARKRVASRRRRSRARARRRGTEEQEPSVGGRGQLHDGRHHDAQRELVIGYSSPAFSPCSCRWSSGTGCSSTGHGFWTTLENAIVGPFIAVISFVCSIGNVPDGRGAVARRHQLRRRRQLHLRRPHRVAAGAHLPEVLRHRTHRADVRHRSGR